MISLNTQPAENHVYNREGYLDIIDIWPTIQGEGPLTGVPSIFVRMAGCNLACKYCDTDYTTGRKAISPANAWVLVTNVQSQFKHIKTLVLTGGEPFRQNFIPFLNTLYDCIDTVQIETNGLLYQEDFFRLKMMPVVVCSPKGHIIHDMIKPHVSALKYVLSYDGVNQNDGLPTKVLGMKQNVARPWPSFKGRIFIQPEETADEDRNKQNKEMAAYICMRFGYHLSLQTHKILGLK